MSKIDDRTTVPFYWLVCCVIFACGGAWATAWWAFGINSDIRELKTNMHLVMKHLKVESASPKEIATDSGIIQNAEAKTK